MAENKKQNFRIGTPEKFYKALVPDITTDEQGIVYFNTDEELSDNALPFALLDKYYNGSSTHSNFINLKRNLIYGNGLQPIDEKDVNLKAFIEKENGIGDSLNEVFHKVALDFAIFEAAALQVIYNAEGKIVEVYHTDVSKVRAEEPDEYGAVRKWYYSSEWGRISNKRQRRYNLKSHAIEIPAFNPNCYEKDDYRQLLYIKRYSAGDVSDVYSIPSYFSSINWIDLDYELSQFHLNKVRNGLFPSGIVSMVGDPDDEDQDKFVNQFLRKHGGASNTGKILFMWNDDQSQAPEFIRMDADTNDDLFEQLNEITTQKIATGHGGSATLAGVDSQGASLGGDANLLNVARSTFIQNVIVDFQEVLLKGFNKISKLNDLGKFAIINEPLRIGMPTEQGDELTRDERRKMLYGLDPMDVSQEEQIEDEAEVRDDNNIEGLRKAQ